MEENNNNSLKILYSPFMYFFLGCYYFLYGLIYPFRLIFKFLGDKMFSVYLKSTEKKSSVVSEEMSDIPISLKIEESSDVFHDDEDNEDDVTIIEEIDKKNDPDDRYTRKKISARKREKYKLAKEQLQFALENDSVRSQVPITYRYVAINDDGKKETNTFSAYSKMEVYTYLENESYDVLSIETSKLINFLYKPSSFLAPKFRNKDLIFWLTQLSTYIKSGIPLTNAMRVLSKQMSKDSNKKRVFDAIIYNLTLGESFSSALEKQTGVFPQLLINMIKAAEATGELEATLDDMANYYTEMENTRKQMISAISYPAIIMVFSIGVVAFILVYIIPKFQDVYTQAGATLNPITNAVIVASKFLQANITYIILIIILFIIGFITFYKKVKVFRLNVQKILMKLPLVGKIIIYKEMSVFAKTFASLLKNNVFITESMDILTNITNNEIYKGIMMNTIENIAKGEKISTSFKNHWAVPDVAYFMIVTGESTGELTNMMDKVADHYQTSHKTIIDSMKSFIEPALIIFLAVVVGGIIMSVILPMFGLTQEIG